MLVNKDLSKFLTALADESIKSSNNEDLNRANLKRALVFFKRRLTEEEQLILLKIVYENLHYKNIVTDPDNVLTLHTIRMKNVTYVFLMIIFILVIAAMLFSTNQSVMNFVSVLQNGFRLLGL